MKKWGFFVLLCVVFILISQLYGASSVGVDIKEQSNQYREIKDSEDIKKVDIRESQIHEGNLLLVSKEYRAQRQSIKKDIVNLVECRELINGYGVLNNQIYLSEEIAREFSDMMLAAGKEGVSNFMVTSGFRSFEEQKALFQDMGSAYALPAGYSEHNLGLSLNIGSTQQKIEYSPEGNWIE